MYIGMYKNINKEIKAIKNGIRRDYVIGLKEKIYFEFNDTKTLLDLQNDVISALKESKSNLIDYEMFCKVIINKIINTKNNYITIFISLISILIFLFGLIFNIATTATFNSINYQAEFLLENNSNIAQDINEIININVNSAVSTIMILFFILLGLLFIGGIICVIKDKIKRDSYIYYNFIYDCIQIHKCKIEEDIKDNK